MDILELLNGAFPNNEGQAAIEKKPITQEMFTNAMFYEKSPVNIRQNPDGSRDLGDRVNLISWQTSSGGDWKTLYAAIAAENAASASKMAEPMIGVYHKHNYVELAFVVQGRLRQRISGKDIEFGEGEICLIGRDSLHADYLLHEDATIMFLSINNSFFEDFIKPVSRETATEKFIREIILRRTEECSYVRFSPKGDTYASRQATGHIISELLRQSPGSQSLICGYTERLLSLLPQEYSINMSKQEKSRFNRILMEDILDYIGNNYQSISLGELALSFNYNEEYISRLIKKRTGMTYVQYLQKLRLSRAMKLIKTSSLTIDDIALQVGYSNLGFFYEKFKQAYGITPRQARQEKRG